MSVTFLPKVTIMIPAYNQEGFIEDAVSSALMQNYPNLEIVVGDDASTDGTAEIVSKIKDDRLKLIRNPNNLGRTANYRNLLFNHAAGDYVVNLDGDDYYTDPEFISDAVKLIDGDKNVVIVQACASWKTHKGINISKIPSEHELDGMDILKRMPSYEFFFMHMASLYHKNMAIQLDFYRYDVTSSDWESLYRLALHGRVRFMRKNIGIWRIHGGNETSIIDLNKFIQNLSIWTSIYKEAEECGMTFVKARVNTAKCIAFFASRDIARISLQGNRELVRFVICLLKHFKLATSYLFIHPFYLARLLCSLLGYYRLRCKEVSTSSGDDANNFS